MVEDESGGVMKKRRLSFTGLPGTIFLVAAVFLLYTCSAKAQNTSSSEMEKKFNEAGLRLLKERVSPRDFSLPLLLPLQGTEGETQRLSDLKGKVVFLNFWATWCGPCRNEMPSMESLYNRYRDRGLEILAVNCQENESDVTAFMRNNRLSFPTALDTDGKISGSYGIQAIPTTFLVDREGNIILRMVGSINWDTQEIHAALEALL